MYWNIGECKENFVLIRSLIYKNKMCTTTMSFQQTKAPWFVIKHNLKMDAIKGMGHIPYIKGNSCIWMKKLENYKPDVPLIWWSIHF